MQRKLSEIAEIPKILSSTLATVSQTFDKLMPGAADINTNTSKEQQQPKQQQQQRKFSYDEDAIDYALNDAGDDDDDADQFADAGSQSEASDSEVKRDLQKLTLKLRDLTPESDYASSASDNDDDFDDDVGDDDEFEDANDAAAGNVSDADDFLTTTFTWRMRKVPQLFLNGQPNEQLESSDEEDAAKSSSDDMEPSVRLPAPKNVELEKPEKCIKLGNHELAWPWADRTKIIYKQSTCHLVPRKSGIIEKSKQLLAKQHLFDQHTAQKLDQQN